MSYIYEEYDLSLFRSRFEDYRRVENFGYDGIEALYNYLDQVATDSDTPIKFDCIALCCEYSRYENLAEFQKDYGDEYESLEDIEGRTIVIRIDDEAFIIASF